MITVRYAQALPEIKFNRVRLGARSRHCSLAIAVNTQFLPLHGDRTSSCLDGGRAVPLREPGMLSRTCRFGVLRTGPVHRR
jgi:hypothetical protein